MGTKATMKRPSPITRKRSGCNQTLPERIAYQGAAYILKGNSDKAIADFNEAIRLDPKLALAYRGRVPGL